MKKVLTTTAVIAGLFAVMLAINLYIPNQRQTAILGATKQQEMIEVAYRAAPVADFAKKSVAAGTTALRLLQTTGTVKNSGEGTNAFVTEINGHAADASKREFWAFYVNGQQAQVGAGSYILKAGDKIEWRIETY